MNHTKIILGVIDVNNFKSINDHYGHIAGDKALIQIASCLRLICEPSAIISRTGGDEFLVILEYSNDYLIDVLINNFENVSIKITEKNFENMPPITISGGFIVCSLNKPIDEMIAKADKNMYIAKTKENNGIVLTFD